MRPRLRVAAVLVISAAGNSVMALFIAFFPPGDNVADRLPASFFVLLSASGLYVWRRQLITVTDDNVQLRWYEIGRTDKRPKWRDMGRARLERSRIGLVRPFYALPRMAATSDRHKYISGFEFVDTAADVVLARLPTAQVGWGYGPWREDDIKALCTLIDVPYVA